MTYLESFADKISKFSIKSAQDIVPPDFVQVRCEAPGYFISRSLIQSSLIRPILQRIYDTLPLIANGPQATIEYDYKMISSLSALLASAISEVDKVMPDNLKLGSIITDAFSNISQFSQYIPHLVSSAATTILTYVPALQQSIMASIADIDRIIASLPKCDEIVKSSIRTSIPQAILQSAQYAVSILSCMELCTADINFLLVNKSVSSNQSMSSSLQKCLDFYSKFSESIFNAALRGQNELTTVLSANFSSTYPSVLSIVEPVIEDRNLFSIAAYNQIVLSRLINKVLADSTIEIAKASMKILAKSIISQDTKEVVNTAKSLLSFSKNFAKDYSVLLNCLQSSKDYNPSWILSVFRLYALTLPDSENAYELLKLFEIEILNLLNDCLSRTKDIVGRLVAKFTENLAGFDEKALSEVNYCTTSLTSIQEYALDDHLIGSLLATLGSLTLLLPSVTKLWQTCINKENSKAISDMVDGMPQIIESFTCWTNQLLVLIGSSVVFKADNYAQILGFFLTKVIDEKGNIRQHISTISNLIQASPHGLMADPTELSKLIQVIETSKSEIIDLKKRIGEMKSPMIDLVSIVGIALPMIEIEDLPCFEQITTIGNIQNQNLFISIMNAFVCGAQTALGKTSGDFCFYFSETSTMVYSICSFVNGSQAFSKKFIHFPASIRSSLDIIWPVASAIAVGNQNQDANSLGLYVSSLSKIIGEIKNCVAQMPTPNLTVNIPEELKEIKKLEAKILSMKNAKLRQTGQTLVNALKVRLPADSRQIISKWVLSSEAQNGNAEEALKSYSETIKNSMTNGKVEIEKIYQKFCELSICISLLSADQSNSGNLTDINKFAAKVQEILIDSAVKFAENQKNLLEALRNLYFSSRIADISVKLSKGRISNINSAFIESIREFIMGLQLQRSHFEQQISTTSLVPVECAASLKTLLLLFNSANVAASQGIAPLLETFQNQFAAQAISQDSISAILSSLIDKYQLIYKRYFDNLNDFSANGTINDGIYSASIAFRDATASLSKDMKSGSLTEFRAASLLRIIVCSCCSTAGIAYQTILRNPQSSSAQFIEGMASIFGSLSSITQIALSKTDNDSEAELRKAMRKVSKEIDTFINIVETPSKSAPEETGFPHLKSLFVTALASVALILADILSLSAYSITPELYTTIFKSVNDRAVSSFATLSSAVVQLRHDGRGQSLANFSSLYTQFESGFKSVLDSAQKLDFTAIYPPIPIIELGVRLTNTSVRLVSASQQLTDVIGPDPVLAAKIPESFTIPVVKASDESEVDLTEPETKFRDSIRAIKSISFNEENESIFAMFSQVMACADSFVSASLALNIQKSKPAISQLAQTISSLYSSFKACLLRSKGFDTEIKAVLPSIELSIDKVIESSKKVEEVEAEDEVTSELKATAHALDDMAARIAQFGAQINVKAVENEPDEVQEVAQAPAELKAEEGTLPAFVISHSTPIIQAASGIMKRAQEITRMTIEKIGHIDNEKLLMKSAQELVDAAELTLITAEMMLSGHEDQPEFKVIAAAKIVRAAASSLVATFLSQGGDPEGILDRHVNVVNKMTQKIVVKFESIAKQKMKESADKTPKKVANKTVMKLNAQNKLSELQKALQEEEKALYAFRKKN